MEQYNPRVDAYIEKAAAFAQPILQHVRKLVHEASPLITENIKWGMPFFEYKGIVCQMAAFKQHCAFGFWKASRLHDPDHLLNPGEEAAAGSFGRINTITDLPPDTVLKTFVLQAMQLNETGEKVTIRKAPVEKPEKKQLGVPGDFMALLDKHPKSKETFEEFSPSHRKEYIEWIIDAKTEATRQKRMEQAVELMAEGKSRHWKYQ